jgi:hypothetical protein
MRLKHTHHRNNPGRVFTLQKEIKTVNNCSKVRAKGHHFVGDFSQVILSIVIDKTGLGKTTDVVKTETFETVSACKQLSFEDGCVVFFANRTDADIEWPFVLLEDTNNFLLTFVG